MNISIYGHGGSANHGNEAIVRGLCKLFNNNNIILYSFLPDSDYKYNLHELCDIKSQVRQYKRYSLEHIISSFLSRMSKSKSLYTKYSLNPFYGSIQGICLLEAGDQYCENKSLINFYTNINNKLLKKKIKTVMLPCTIPEELFLDGAFINELKKYSLIFAREKITYNSLIIAGLGKTARFAPCTAFIMDPKPCNLPSIFHMRKIVGITVGELAQGKSNYTKAVFDNSRELIRYIINETEYAIALIPHVNVSEKLTDINIINKLFNEFNGSERIVAINEQRADEQKYIIKNCNFLITVRTHASIAAYSLGIPTLVIGYSQKSRGIAQDLFGTDEHYVVGVDTLDINEKLINSFKWLVENEISIKNKLQQVLPDYLSKVNIVFDEIVKL